MARPFHPRPLRLPLIIILAAGLLLPASYTSVSAPEPVKSGRYYEPVEVPGEMLISLLGKSISGLSVYSWRDGAWTPVLFQVDERTPEGDFILTRGPEADPESADGRLDDQDLVVFMARDAGALAPEGRAPPGADIAVPVELVEPLTGSGSFAYVAWFEKGAPENNLEPISTLIDLNDKFNFQFRGHEFDGLINRRENVVIPTIYMDRFRVKPEAGGSGENIIDRQKVRGQITFLGGAIKVPINEKIVSGGVVAYKPGPVRILTHSCMYPLFPLGIKGPKFYIDSILVDTLSLTAIKVDVPFDPGFLIHDMTLAFGMDLTPAAKGMRLYNSVNPGGVLIDGRMDRAEKGFDTRKDDWRLITGPQGTQIVSTDFDPKFMADGTASTTYNDDESEAHPPENHPGDVGASFDQILVKSLTAGAYRIEVFGCVPFHFHDPEGLDLELLEDIMRVKTDPLVVKVGDNRATNQGGRPRTVVDRKK